MEGEGGRWRRKGGGREGGKEEVCSNAENRVFQTLCFWVEFCCCVLIL